MKHDIPFSVAPFHQTNWDWRAAGNFIGGGSGTGLLLFAALAPSAAYRIEVLAALVFIAAGLTCVWIEIGKPLRAINVFRHPQTSWMTREGLVALPLFASGLAALVFGGWSAAAWVSAALAMVFVGCQARILLASKGIPAWREPRLGALILATSLAEGCGWAVLLAAVSGEPAPARLAGLLIGLMGLRAWAWRSYLGGLRARGAPAKALAVLERAERSFLLAGNALPAFLAAAGLVLGSTVLAAVAGLLAAAAGGWIKYVIVARAAFNQGFALPMLPVRGVGVPGPAVRPGWSGGTAGGGNSRND
ncbi:MAG: hypothetical protein Fur0039_12720 [Rhodocyclaceae bacterium]